MVDSVLRDAVARRLRSDTELAEHNLDRSLLRRAVARALAAEGVVASPERWAQLVRDLVDELGGFGPLERLLRDPGVTDIMVNRPDEVFVERAGTLERSAATFDDDDHVRTVIARALGPVGARLDRTQPYVDVVLSGGIRLHAVIPPLATCPTMTLRRVPAVAPTWDELRESGSVSDVHASQLRSMVQRRRNIVVAGRAGVGKTTLLSCMLAEVGGDRVVVIEDTPEIRQPGTHTVHLRTREPSAEGVGAVTIADLVRNALRMRPDRIVVGEVRGVEVADLLQAMNTGHAGSLCTVHANSAADALVRIEGMALLAGVPLAAARAQMAAAIDLVVAMDRDGAGQRVVTEIARVERSGDGLQLVEVND
ncbi:MAG: ATPase, T2SS/T4P/T4SS family [Nitriliruptoraceae bacterium]